MAKFYEVYEGMTSQNRKKTYLVFKYVPSYVQLCDVRLAAKKYFKCSEEHIVVTFGYVKKGELFLIPSNRKPENIKLVRVAYYV